MDHSGIQLDPRETRGLDRPDRWDSEFDPPFNKRVRHGRMGTWAYRFLLACSLGMIGFAIWAAYDLWSMLS